jgi:cysteine desulfurase
MPALVYLDNAATTRVAPEVAALMRRCMVEDYGNPSCQHGFGAAARAHLERARQRLFAAVGDPTGTRGRIVFTSCGTEADAFAVLGAARARAASGRHVLVPTFEHQAILGNSGVLRDEGFRETAIEVGRDGVLDPAAFSRALRADTVLVTCMLVQNELGTIQPVAEIVRAVRARRGGDVHIHCDAVQALGKVPIDVTALDVDSLALSGHKIHAAKGVGALWLRRGSPVNALWQGAAQEGALRAGTENVPGIAGFGLAAEMAVARMTAARERLTKLRHKLLGWLTEGVPAFHEIGNNAVPHILAIGFKGFHSDRLVTALQEQGICISGGSACGGVKGHTHVHEAIGVPPDTHVVRISLSRYTTEKDVARAARWMVRVARTVGGAAPKP